MFNSLLAGLEIRFVGPFSSFKPGNMLWAGYRQSCSAMFARAAEDAVSVINRLAHFESGRCRWIHLDNVGQRAEGTVLLVAMAATFAMMLLTLLCDGRAKGRESLVIIEGGSSYVVFFQLVSASGS
jgi:hypothetical protein